MNRFLSLVLPLTFVPAALAAGAAPVVDQNFTTPGGIALGANMNLAYRWVGQSFTAGVSGMLTRADVSIHPYGSDHAPFFFELWEVNASHLPVGSRLAYQLVPYAQVGTQPHPLYTFVSFSFPATVVEGRQYALLATALVSTTGDGAGSWLGVADSNPYAGGMRLYGNTPLSMQVDVGDDCFFRTWVQVPEPAAAALLLIGPARRRRR